MAVAKKFTATTTSLAAPIGGWNARDSLAEMNPLDAVQMVNFFPTPTDITLRKGYTKTSTGITGEVETLMNYANYNGTNTLFAVANGVIYNASTSTATSVFTGLTNSRFQHCMISTDGGNFLIAVNGADAAMLYDGTRWYKMATTTTAQTISTITRGGAGNLTATLTTATAHGLATGNRVTISGATPTQFNGTYYITVTGTTTFTYTMASAPSGDATVVGTYSVIGISGANSNTFINVNMCQNRLFFVQKNTMTFWYLPVESIGGAALDCRDTVAWQGYFGQSYSSADNIPIKFGTGNYTIEGWVRADVGASTRGIFQIYTSQGTTTPPVLSGSVGGIGLGRGIGTSFRFWAGANDVSSLSGSFPDSTYTHFAIVRNGTGASNTKVYINGTALSQLTVTDATDYTGYYFALGGWFQGSNTTYGWRGQIDEFRISKYAVYTSNFTPYAYAFPDS